MKIKPIILYLKNGGEELDTTVKAVRFFHDALTPVRGIVSINGTGMPSKGIETMIKQAVDYGMPSIGTKYHQLWLANRSDSTIKFPLGWYISDTVIHAIEARVKEIKVKDSVFMRDMVPLLK